MTKIRTSITLREKNEIIRRLNLVSAELSAIKRMATVAKGKKERRLLQERREKVAQELQAIDEFLGVHPGER